MESRFQLSLHRWMGAAFAERPSTIHGIPITELLVPPEALEQPLAVTFEDACRELASFPRMFVEADGSFVWTSPADVHPRWQVDGQLVDRGSSLQTVELAGDCKSQPFERLANVFRGSDDELIVRLARQGICLREREFRLLLDVVTRW